MHISKITNKKVFSSVLAFGYLVSLSVSPSYSYNFQVEELEEVSNVVQMGYLTATNDGFLLKNTPVTTDGDVSKVVGLVDYTVQEDDSIESIAEKFAISSKTLKNHNNIVGDYVSVGQNLSILPVDGVLYKIRRNDTLEGIAKVYNIESVDDLKKQNDIESESELVAGDTIILPGVEKLEQPVRYIASRGYAKRTIPANNQDTPVVDKVLIKPCEGVYTQYFRRGHYAVDIAMKGGTTVYATASGTIGKAKASGRNMGYGNHVIINHDDSLKTLSAHLQEVYVSEGDVVVQGQPIGYMGNTGRSSGTHLHFEVIKEGYKKNPLAYY